MKRPVLLMVDDDEEDIYLTKLAFCSENTDLNFQSVQSSQDLFDYLNCRGNYSSNGIDDLPDVILLDVNIPKIDGYEILRKLKQDSKFNYLPVVMMTTSVATNDIRRAYQFGANSFISKSASADGMKRIAELFCGYWFSFNQLPHFD